MSNPLIQLPNKDLWRPQVLQPADVVAADAELVPETAQNPVNRAMAQILKSSAGARELTCQWCGVQSDERYMRKHIEEQHKSMLYPPSASDAALATLAVQQKPALEAAANRE